MWAKLLDLVNKILPSFFSRATAWTDRNITGTWYDIHQTKIKEKLHDWKTDYNNLSNWKKHDKALLSRRAD
jgi:hypothetical protein